jgi:hypothetical protein
MAPPFPARYLCTSVRAALKIKHHLQDGYESIVSRRAAYCGVGRLAMLNLQSSLWSGAGLIVGME